MRDKRKKRNKREGSGKEAERKTGKNRSKEPIGSKNEELFGFGKINIRGSNGEQ